MELRDYLRLFRRRWLVIAVVAVSTFLLTRIFSPSPRPVYSSWISFHYRVPTLLLSEDSGVKELYPMYLTSPEMRPLLITSEEVMNLASESLKREGLEATPAEIRGAISAKLGSNPGIIEIRSSHFDADRSKRFRDAVRSAYVEYELKMTDAMLGDEVKGLQTRVNELDRLASEAEGSLKKLLSEKYLSRGVANPEVEAKNQAQLVIDLQRLRQDNLIEANRIALLLKKKEEEIEKFNLDQMLRRHSPFEDDFRPSGQPAEELSKQLEQLDLALRRMKKKYQEVHPGIREAKEQIQEMHERIREATAKAKYERRENLLLQKALLEEMAVLLTDVIRKEYETSFRLEETRREFEAQSRSVEQIQQRAIRVKERLDQAETARQIQRNRARAHVTVLEEGGPSGSLPVAPFTLSILFALFLAIAAAFVMEYLSPYVVTENDLRRHLNLKTLTTMVRIPEAESEYLVVGPATPLSEFFSSFALQLENLSKSRGGNCFIIASPNRDEGKTTITVNTGLALARAGSRVLVIDGDLHKPTVGKFLGMEEPGGLSTFLADCVRQGGISEEELVARAAELARPTSENRLNAVLAGPALDSPLELLRHPDFERLLLLYKQEYDFVLIDTPAVNLVADTLYLSRLGETVVLVVGSGQTKKEELQMLRRRLDTVWDKIAGCVLNKARVSVAGYYYYHYYYKSGYHYRRETK